ncbi:deaminase [Nonomuraea sp. NPDC050786]|uniref:dihydrofolate reductase family protein n=1 Tax=Nonomuraea sp. NPDC050786 TaxID=3154840 RepID=UPI0033EA13EA
MGSVIASMTMSLDGFVAGPNDEVDDLFAWYDAVRAGAGVFPPGALGSLVCGRRLFELTNAWGGRHPMGAHVFVVTHSVPDAWPREDTSFTFVTDGVASAVRQAKDLAGGRDIAIATPTITQQCLDLGLVDMLAVDLVPVLLGKGIQLFAGLAMAPVELGTPTVIEGENVTHLRYPVHH